uniref:Uncharacterized protein n=2 Tax=Calcidiscus leptoporus TaxID=127549 RepID=A0A7S0P5M6_9EUKA|mmetsp:Transcript_9189/g.21313  ORF Transcript_9189/g.21313 Transcript_9189/m.21313 type:complete len:379 (+) Transcript_9189:2-1138(+)
MQLLAGVRALTLLLSLGFPSYGSVSAAQGARKKETAGAVPLLFHGELSEKKFLRGSNHSLLRGRNTTAGAEHSLPRDRQRKCTLFAPDRTPLRFSREAARRVAHVISNNLTRLEPTKRSLESAGFSVSTVDPIPAGGALVRKRAEVTGADNRTLGVLSLALTHERLHRLFPTTRDWLYVFEDDALFNGERQRNGGNWSSASVQSLLDRAELVAEHRGSPLLYLGTCAPDFPAKRRPDWRREELIRQPHIGCGDEPLLWLRPCASLCTHAVAVHRSAATLLSRTAAMFVGRNHGVSVLHRLNIDVMLRRMFQDGLLAPRDMITRTDQSNLGIGPPPPNSRVNTWPTCLVSNEADFGGLENYFVQNKNHKSQVGAHWRRS